MKCNLLHALLPAVLVLTIVSCSTDAETIQEPTTTIQTSNYDYNADELELMDLINAHRQSIGLQTLQPADCVSLKSEEHTEYMIEMNAINHDHFSERSQSIIETLGASKVSENVAYNYSTANAVLHAWLESPGHQINIEGDFTHFGVAIRVDPESGNKYYTNIFMKK